MVELEPHPGGQRLKKLIKDESRVSRIVHLANDQGDEVLDGVNQRMKLLLLEFNRRLAVFLTVEFFSFRASLEPKRELRTSDVMDRCSNV